MDRLIHCFGLSDEIRVLLIDFLADQLEKCLVCVVLHTNQFTEHRQVEPISLPLSSATIENVTDTQGVTDNFEEVRVGLNLFVSVHDTCVESLRNHFFFSPLLLERPNLKSVENTGWVDQLDHVGFSLLPNFTIL